ncbi:MAG: hypothetical protein K8U03_16435 [Planctomycetia bacterium]|nr:hypothetical protein [Planctomycetia bacterium]
MADEMAIIARQLNSLAMSMEHHGIQSVMSRGMEAYRRLHAYSFQAASHVQSNVEAAMPFPQKHAFKDYECYEELRLPRTGTIEANVFLAIDVNHETGESALIGIAADEVTARRFSAFRFRYRDQTTPVIVSTTIKVPCRSIPVHAPCTEIKAKASGSRILELG